MLARERYGNHPFPSPSSIRQSSSHIRVVFVIMLIATIAFSAMAWSVPVVRTLAFCRAPHSLEADTVH